MTASLEAGPLELLATPTTHRRATLWKITRTDSATFFFTDHDEEIEFTDGATYSPSGGLDASARRKSSGLQPGNLDATGPVSTDEITIEDLQDRRFDGAQVDEYEVDWLYPWIGALGSQRYWIDTVEFDGERWVAEVEGVSRWFRANVVRTATRGCRRDLGDGQVTGRGCQFALEAHKIANVRIVTVTDDRNFTANSSDIPSSYGPLPLTIADGVFQLGSVRWISGDNAGDESEVKNYTHSTRAFELFIPTAQPIQTSDTFIAIPGCDKAKTTCVNRYDQLENYGGHETMPGGNARVAIGRGQTSFSR